MDRYAKGQSRQFARQQDSLAQPVIQAFDFQFKETLENFLLGKPFSAKAQSEIIRKYRTWFNSSTSLIAETKNNHTGNIYFDTLERPKSSESILDSFVRICSSNLYVKRKRIRICDYDLGLDISMHAISRYMERTRDYRKKEFSDIFLYSYVYILLLRCAFLINKDMGEKQVKSIVPAKNGCFIGYFFNRRCLNKDVIVDREYICGNHLKKFDSQHPFFFETSAKNRSGFSPTMRIRTFIDEKSLSSSKEKIIKKLEKISEPIFESAKNFVDLFINKMDTGKEVKNSFIKWLIDSETRVVLNSILDYMASDEYINAIGAISEEEISLSDFEDYGGIHVDFDRYFEI